jgi:hypothetical protein
VRLSGAELLPGEESLESSLASTSRRDLLSSTNFPILVVATDR